MKKYFTIILTVTLFGIASNLLAVDLIDKVYHPYVLSNEREFEWRLVNRKTDSENRLAQRIALGHSVSDKLTLELYLVGEDTEMSNFSIEAYELEVRWMMTEKGQFWADWGMLFEIEKQHLKNVWEASAAILFEKELGRTSLTMNIFATYNFSDDVENELNPEFRLQYRYRWMPSLQPAVEFYSSDDYNGIGPAFMGLYRFQGQRQIKWEAAYISGLNGQRRDDTLRFAVEFEF